MSGHNRHSGQPLRLGELVARLERAGLLRDRPDTGAQILGIADDSRVVREGDLFCAWTGTARDAHVFAPAAAAAGAAALLVEHAVGDVSIPQVIVSDGRRAAAVAASAFYADPQEELLLAGVTGTNGKSTAVWILRHVLGGRIAAASLGTLGVILEDGSTLPGSSSLTTPGPVELARTLRLLVDRGVEAVAMEVSSHALAQGRVHALRYAAAVFTNLSHDHLDFHGTYEAYRQAKLSFTGLLQPAGWAVFNADDDAWHGIEALVPHALSFGTVGHADVRAARIDPAGYGATFELCTAHATTHVTLPLPGSFNISNALAAGSAALALGFSPTEIAARLATVPQVPGRLERIADAPCTVLRDYAHTPDALERALAALRPVARGRLIVVFGAGGDRDRGKRPAMGAAAAAGADVVIVTSDNPRTEDPDVIIDEIVAGMTAGGYLRITDRREAIAAALAMAGADDVILLAGKGHEVQQIIGTTAVPFDERRIVAELRAVPEVRG